jgi:putative Ca2+/H+ antiporter (TMEM165/GDT1 family)
MGTPHEKVPTTAAKSDPPSEGVISPMHSLLLSFTMIMVSEIGDKTFLVAALMAMRHPRQVVFSAAFTALVLMTVLSALLGHAVPALLPKRLTSFAAAGLFLFFGVKLTREGLAMPKEAGVGEEMLEVEQELEEKEAETLRNFKSDSTNGSLPYIVEEARSRSPSPSRTKSLPSTSTIAGLINLCSLLLSPAWVQTFVMTFLGEWGDRSQISTIAMAAGKDWFWVTIGAIFGHSICTAIAVIGGRAIAGKVSMRMGKFRFLISTRSIANSYV